MKTITVIALVNQNIGNNRTDKSFLKQSLGQGTVYTLQEFEKLWNADEVRVGETFMRVLEVQLKLKL